MENAGNTLDNKKRAAVISLYGSFYPDPTGVGVYKPFEASVTSEVYSSADPNVRFLAGRNPHSPSLFQRAYPLSRLS
jgi:hypothetical protein